MTVSAGILAQSTQTSSGTVAVLQAPDGVGTRFSYLMAVEDAGANDIGIRVGPSNDDKFNWTRQLAAGHNFVTGAEWTAGANSSTGYGSIALTDDPAETVALTTIANDSPLLGFVPINQEQWLILSPSETFERQFSSTADDVLIQIVGYEE